MLNPDKLIRRRDAAAFNTDFEKFRQYRAARDFRMPDFSSRK